VSGALGGLRGKGGDAWYSAGVGLLLWNIAYDYVLRLSGQYYRPGCSIVGYADDTLILCVGNSLEVVQSNVNAYLRSVMRRIEFLSLEVAPEKTGVILFYGRKRVDARNFSVRIGNTVVQPRLSMKYLGVILDSKLNFKNHFTYINEKVGKVSRALGRLMPNLRGPMEKKRRLYAGIITSMVLYAAPIWVDSLAVSGDSRRLFRRWQRVIALRVCAAYRSVSFDSATLLARLVPYELLAAERARVFWRTQDAKAIGADSPGELMEIRTAEGVITKRQWSLFISRPESAGRRLRDAILPYLGAWMTRPWGAVTFRITQLLTGHGCFGTFLERIGKADTAICPFCEMVDDSPDHTISGCPEWREERAALVDVIGPDLSLSGIIGAMCGSKEGWLAFSAFAEKVMRSKEDAERAREAMLLSPGTYDPA